MSKKKLLNPQTNPDKEGLDFFVDEDPEEYRPEWWDEKRQKAVLKEIRRSRRKK